MNYIVELSKRTVLRPDPWDSFKWQFQPAKQTSSWRYTIRNARRELKYLIDDNPSLKNFPQVKLQSAYKDAVIMAAGETGLDEREFPSVCPYTVEQLLDEEWLA